MPGKLYIFTISIQKGNVLPYTLYSIQWIYVNFVECDPELIKPKTCESTRKRFIQKNLISQINLMH